MLWDDLLHIVGAGAILLALAIVAVLGAVWWHKISYLWRWWNHWLGFITFAIAILGLFALIGKEGLASGGSWGNTITFDRNLLLGILIIVAAILVSITLVGPRFAWWLTSTLARKAIPLLKQAGGELETLVLRLRQFYSEHPVHQSILAWFEKHRAPEKVKDPPLIPPPKVTSELPVTEPEFQINLGEPLKVGPTPSSSPSRGLWQLPTIDLLDEPIEIQISEADIEKRARLIEEALASYGVEAKVAQINAGPTVTQFGVEPGWDRKYKGGEEISRTRVKVERITSLDKDLALALAAPAIRIEAPVPGKSIVGVEVPNVSMGIVVVREVMESAAFQKISSRSKLALTLGKGAAGESVVGDLNKMPHLLIAGATGSGKTVCLNSIIASLLMSNTPEELQFIMIDPKRVELVHFNGTPHLMSPVITESERSVEILKWFSLEMDNRFKRLATIGTRNIETYNKSPKVVKLLPYLILIIDELADLMIAKSGDVEPLLCRLAQLGRAVGIHLVVATQRPSVDVITGLIKANFPSRISFNVSSQVDSRTILDTVGAEKLLGRGDMLYLPPEAAKPKRLQGTYVSETEIERLVNFWKEQQIKQPDLAKVLPAYEPTKEEEDTQRTLLDQARRLASDHRQISTSYLQRQLRIGYARAAQIMELLEQEGTVKQSEAGKNQEGD
jgi:DNA segregation ATPase FtsK/SpoIIIE-like protein